MTFSPYDYDPSKHNITVNDDGSVEVEIEGSESYESYGYAEERNVTITVPIDAAEVVLAAEKINQVQTDSDDNTTTEDHNE